ncbi:MAG: porin family protein, partial [Bacteroidota bacterium]
LSHKNRISPMTRSISILLLASLFHVCGLHAQQNNIQFGFQLSPTFSNMNTSDNLINSDGTNLGLKMGLVGEIPIGDNYAITTGLGFHFNAGGTLFFEDRYDRVDIWNQVSEVGDTSFAGGTSFKYNLQFVEIPFGLTLRTREFGYLRYYLQPLITLGFSTRSRGNVKNVAFIDENEDYDIGSAVNAINLSWGIGAGVEYLISSETFLFGGLAFQSGFADITQDRQTVVTRDGVERQEDSRGKINSIVLRLGVMF